MDKYIHDKVWGEIVYPFSNFDGCAIMDDSANLIDCWYVDFDTNDWWNFP